MKDVERIIGKYYFEFNELKQLSGDASSRRYFRFNTKFESRIIVLDEPNSQQVTDYVEINNLLPEGLRRPKLYEYDFNYCYLIQEDVGDSHLFDYQNNQNLKELALRDILLYQNMNVETFKFQNKKFDQTKLSFEFELACENFIKRYAQKSIDKNLLAYVNEKIIDLFSSNIVICHRDYHCKNIMVQDEELVHIDFQDSMIGHYLYDAVSFIEDPYAVNDKESLIEYYFRIQNHYTDMNIFMKDYALVAFQRLFKALGSYTFLNYEKNKSSYLKYIEPALKNLKDQLQYIEDERIKKLIVEVTDAN